MAAVETDTERASEALLALLVFAAKRDVRITRTKAVKLLYLADLRTIADTGFAASGIAWRWWHYGPYSQALRPIEDTLVAIGVVDRQTVRRSAYEEESVLTVRDDIQEGLSALTYSADPFVTNIDTVLAELGQMNATQLTAFAYKTAPMVDATENGNKRELLDLGEHPDADPDADIAAGRVTYYGDSESFLASLEA